MLLKNQTSGGDTYNFDNLGINFVEFFDIESEICVLDDIQ